MIQSAARVLGAAEGHQRRKRGRDALAPRPPRTASAARARGWTRTSASQKVAQVERHERAILSRRARGAEWRRPFLALRPATGDRRTGAYSRPCRSRRLDWDPARERARGPGSRGAPARAPLDLTETNPTRVGLAIRTGDRRGAGPRPRRGPTTAPLGPARGARRGRGRLRAPRASTVASEPLVLTASSSESYGFLFKLLCDPGDAVLVPEPSYPLFEYLARLEGVRPVPYRLAFDGVWHVDLASVDEALARAGDGTRRARSSSSTRTTRRARSSSATSCRALAGRCEAHGPGRRSPTRSSPPYAVGDPTRRACTHRRRRRRVRRPRAAFSAGRPVQVLRPAAAQARLDRRRRARDAARPHRRARAGRRHLPFGRRARAGGAAAICWRWAREARAAIAARVAGTARDLAAALPPASRCTLLPTEGGWSAILRVPADAHRRGVGRGAARPRTACWCSLATSSTSAGGTFLVLSLLPRV